MRRPADARLPTSAFTVDVEDWYQSCWDFDAPISERVIRNVERILQMLADSGVRGTFFIQGRVAETFPGLVETIVGQGHEVQSHGYSHRPLFGMNHAELRDELERAKKTVEDAAGVEVTSFRAPDFSIRRNNLWALRVLSEVGFRTDSSVFPMRTRRYGVGGSPLAPHRVSVGDAEILEVPVAIWSRAGFRVPMAGGGYFRLIPRAAIERGYGRSSPAGVRRSSTAIRTSLRLASWTTIRTFPVGCGCRSPSAARHSAAGSSTCSRRAPSAR